MKTYVNPAELVANVSRILCLSCWKKLVFLLVIRLKAWSSFLSSVRHVAGIFSRILWHQRVIYRSYFGLHWQITQLQSKPVLKLFVTPCHALKQRQCYGYCFQALLGYLLSIYTYFFMLGFTGLCIVYLYPNFFLLRPLRDVNFTASLTQVKDLSLDLIAYFTLIQTDT